MRPAFALGLVLLLSLACGRGGRGDRGGTGLRPSSDLKTDCLGFPGVPPTPDNRTRPKIRLETGDRAVDFTLQGAQGGRVRLGDLLAKKPVLLVQGSWTCPVFQGNRTALEETARKYGDRLEVVHVYNIDAHPKQDPSPYTGRPWQLEFSDMRQPTSFDERLRAAKRIARESSLLVLVDTFDAPGANPVWCTYGTCASCAWLIAQDGRIAASHDWYDPPSMDGSIEALLQAP